MVGARLQLRGTRLQDRLACEMKADENGALIGDGSDVAVRVADHPPKRQTLFIG